MAHSAFHVLKPLILAFAIVLFLPATTYATNKQIKLDLDVTRLTKPGQGDRGPVAISAVTDARALTPAGTSDATPQSTLVGQYLKKSDAIYDVILVGGKDVTDIVNEVIAMNLTQLGYVVVDADSPEGKAAPSLAISINKFWVENDPAGGSNKKSFDCVFSFTVESNSEPFEKMGTVSGSGFRNGSRATNPKSYSNSLLHSLKFVMQDFERKYDNALRSFAKTDLSLDDAAIDKILEARQLRDDGVISDEEFQQIKKKFLVSKYIWRNQRFAAPVERLYDACCRLALRISYWPAHMLPERPFQPHAT